MRFLKLLLFVGLMAYSFDVSAQSVFVTKTGEKFHKSTCHYLKYSKKEISFEKALELHFTACSVCKPNAKGNRLGIMSTSTKSTPSTPSVKNTTTT